MAKGRKLTASRSERYLGSYGYVNGHHDHVTAAEADAEELGEEDVWSSMVGGMVKLGGDDDGDDDRSTDSRGEWSPRAAAEGDARGRGGGQLRQVGGLSLAFEDTTKTASSPRVVHQFRGQDSVSSRPRGGRHLATSAPVNVPDWSKIYRVDSVESLHDSDEGLDDREPGIVPPHEFLAREHRKNSVFEGVGRTLKGRDLRRVRDAVWSQTGFDG